jgi:hypothetical protein
MVVVAVLIALALPVNTTLPLTFRACFNTHGIQYRLDSEQQNMIPINAYNDMMIENICT